MEKKNNDVSDPSDPSADWSTAETGRKGWGKPHDTKNWKSVKTGLMERLIQIMVNMYKEKKIYSFVKKNKNPNNKEKKNSRKQLLPRASQVLIREEVLCWVS